jgi:hypothetical protein
MRGLGMEKRWLLRLPRDLDDWLTLKAAEQTVKRGKRVSKNTLIIELASDAREAKVPDPTIESSGTERWQEVKSALAFIQETIEVRTDMDSPGSDRLKQRISVNLKMLESYLEDLGE